MKQALRMFAVLCSVTLVSGASLGSLFEATHELAENNILKFKKIPAVVVIHSFLEGVIGEERRIELEAKLLAEKRYADVGAADSLLLFVLEKEGKPHAVTLEEFGQGFGGELGVMVGFELETGHVVGVGVTTMSETPGIGTRIRETAFTAQFAGIGSDAVLKVKKDGGQIDAVSGATVSSRAVAEAVGRARAVYDEHAATIREAVMRAPASATEDVAALRSPRGREGG
jgi:electron transport complex protein RnfG